MIHDGRTGTVVVPAHISIEVKGNVEYHQTSSTVLF
jgi:hypothetical protein